MIKVKKWTEKDKKKLIELYQLGYTYKEIGVKMDCSCFAAQSKMKLLHLLGRVGYRTSESEAAANERGLFKPEPVEFEDNGPSDEGAEQADDCPDNIREAMTAKTARTNTIFNEILENIRVHARQEK